MNADRLSELARDALAAGRLDEALRLAEQLLDLEVTDRQWGLGFVHSVLERMKEAGADVEGRLTSVRDELLERGAEDAHWGHRWERARQLNGRAWAVVDEAQDCSNPDHLRSRIDQALSDIDEALAFDPLACPWVDTKVRLLLAAGRRDEAFECIRRVELIEPDWPDFEQERASEAYIGWRGGEDDVRPGGLATIDEVLHVVPEELRTSATAHLGSAERAALRASRIGPRECDRAQHAALIGLRLEAGLSAAELAVIKPWEVDLSRGLLQQEGRGQQLSERLVSELRHWMLYAAHNHPAVHQPVGSYHPVRHQLFFDWDSGRPMSQVELSGRLACCADRLGIRDAVDSRWPRAWFDGLRSVRRFEDEGRLQQVRSPSEVQAVGRAVASVHAWLCAGEDTWILYSYEVDGAGYGFVYLTPYDELHRHFGDHPREWYDDLVGSFGVRFDPAAPERHRVEDPRFVGLHDRVSFVGRARGPVTGLDDLLE